MSIDRIVLKEGAPHDPGRQARVPGPCGCATRDPTAGEVLQRSRADTVRLPERPVGHERLHVESVRRIAGEFGYA